MDKLFTFFLPFSFFYASFSPISFVISFFCRTFAPAFRVLLRYHQAQMAESVDALVSNTSGATRAGSTPALGTL